MASTHYIDRVTHIEAEWANDTDALVYTIFGGAQTKQQALDNLGLGGMAKQSDSEVAIIGGAMDGVSIGLDNPSPAHFSWALISESPINPLHATNKAYVDSLFVASGGVQYQHNTVNLGTPDVEFLNFNGGVVTRSGHVVNVTLDANLTEDIQVIGTSVGAVPEGYTFPTGLNFTDFVMLISQKNIPPTYTAPTAQITGYPDLIISGNPFTGTVPLTEVGTVKDIQFTTNFNQNDGGSSTATRIKKNGTTISNLGIYTDLAVLYDINPTLYTAEFDYGQGPIKNDNMGNPYPTGRIGAGTAVSNTLTVIGTRVAFYGTPASTPTNSAQVRVIGPSSFNTTNNPDVDAAGSNLVPSPTPSFTITIPIGATRVCFAYPDTSRAVASVRYQELSDSEVKGNFTLTTISVQGANGYAAVNYKVYTYVPVEAFTQAVHYKVFI